MRLSKERFEMIKNADCGMSCADCELSDCCYSIQELIDEIEALQQENEQYQERLKGIETTAKAIIRDRTEQDKVLIMAEIIEKMCGVVGEKITKRLVYRNKELQQENEQLKAQAAIMREALKSIYYGPYQLHKGYVEILEEALATDAGKDYHNSADVDALEKAREALKEYAFDFNCAKIYRDKGLTQSRLMQILDTIKAIDKAIGGDYDENKI